jgi:hypothetical protein
MIVRRTCAPLLAALCLAALPAVANVSSGTIPSGSNAAAIANEIELAWDDLDFECSTSGSKLIITGTPFGSCPGGVIVMDFKVPGAGVTGSPINFVLVIDCPPPAPLECSADTLPYPGSLALNANPPTTLKVGLLNFGPFSADVASGCDQAPALGPAASVTAALALLGLLTAFVRRLRP